jgi:hypothetical protein
MKTKKGLLKWILLSISVVAVVFFTFFYKNDHHVYLPGTYETGNLEGRKAGGLYASYFGIKPGTKIPETITTDFHQNLKTMWKKKIGRSPSPVVEETAKKLLGEYPEGQTKMSFSKYSSHITDVVDNVRDDIDWDSLRVLMHMSKKEASLAKKITGSFDGEDMAAYIMTELMPSADGKFNVEVMNFLLTNAGTEYIEGIPALGDCKTSFGPYQFTEYALFETPKEKRGASIINMAITNKRSKIPGSVCLLRGDDHHKAAYMFATYNVCMLVKACNKKRLETLDNVWRANKDDLFIYCATAHHLPAKARKAAKNWLHNKAKESFETSCSKRIEGYAIKTRANLKAI